MVVIVIVVVVVVIVEGGILRIDIAAAAITTDVDPGPSPRERKAQLCLLILPLIVLSPLARRRVLAQHRQGLQRPRRGRIVQFVERNDRGIPQEAAQGVRVRRNVERLGLVHILDSLPVAAAAAGALPRNVRLGRTDGPLGRLGELDGRVGMPPPLGGSLRRGFIFGGGGSARKVAIIFAGSVRAAAAERDDGRVRILVGIRRDLLPGHCLRFPGCMCCCLWSQVEMVSREASLLFPSSNTFELGHRLHQIQN
mmetsp:Transcript_9101/g.27253  ORF Transcript_9101/g.27253 Transcript_9101/m.27253 type:complete len:253 (+) Transcript_9101:1823-2581(+)